MTAAFSATTFETAIGRLSPFTLSGPMSANSVKARTESATRDVTRIWPSAAASLSRAAVFTTVPMAL